LIGHEFADCTDAAFSNVHVWGALGGAGAFAYSTYLCTRTKLIILIAMLVLSVLGYVAAELIYFRRRGGKGVMAERGIGKGIGRDMGREEQFPLMEGEEEMEGDDEEEEEEETLYMRKNVAGMKEEHSIDEL
jgi:hypothetical protein